jgi:hypothetical protein
LRFSTDNVVQLGSALLLTLDGLSRSSRPLVPPHHVRIRSSTPDIPLIRESSLYELVRTRTRTRHHTTDILRMSSLELVDELECLGIDDGDLG